MEGEKAFLLPMYMSTIKPFRIGSHTISPAAPCFIIAEIAQTHDGSLGQAHAFIDAVARTGAAAIKFQTHIAAAESTHDEPWRVKFSRQDATRYEYWERMEFTAEQWAGLKQHADDVGLVFLSSAFSLAAVDLLHRIGMPAWKIASGEVNNHVLLEAIAATEAPILLSSGMSSYSELDQAVEFVREHGREVAVFQCTTKYPCPPESIGLNVIGELRDRYQCAAGLSDHSGTPYPALAGAALGMELLEVHVTLSREMFGPDVPASVTTSELKQMVDGIQFIESMRRNPIVKDEMAEEMEPLRQLFNKSIVAAQAIPAGTTITREMLKVKKPGSGLPAQHLTDFIGKTTTMTIERDEQLRWEHI